MSYHQVYPNHNVIPLAMRRCRRTLRHSFLRPVVKGDHLNLEANAFQFSSFPIAFLRTMQAVYDRRKCALASPKLNSQAATLEP